MWIRSQSKRVLTNGTISYIVTGRNDIIIRNENNSNDNYGYSKIAEYSTEEKALKVLDMIEECIGTYMGKPFQMPQDSEV